MAVKKSYTELMRLQGYDARLRYLKTNGKIGIPTFGEERYLNQAFYLSNEWSTAKRQAIIRDNGFDLCIKELPILGRIVVHHINPITLTDLIEGSPLLTDLDNLICCSFDTHNKIHFLGESKHEDYVERHPGDTCLWRRKEKVCNTRS